MGDSEAAFRATVKELGLENAIWSKLEKNGWSCFSDFAFAVPDPTGRDVQGFEEKIVPMLLDVEKDDERKLLPRLRRLYAQAYAVANTAMAAEHAPQNPTERVHLNSADRTARLQKMKLKVTGFELKHQNMPSTALIDRMVTILVRGFVRWVAWEHCTSQEQEMMSEVETKGLRITPEGLLLQDVAPETCTTLAGEFLWDYAFRRKAVACDIAGLCSFQTMDAWTETLKLYLLKSPPTGYRRVSWGQVLEADRAIWNEVAVKCEGNVKADPTRQELNGLTAFEYFFKDSIFSPDVRAHLMFLPGSSSSSGSAGPSVTAVKQSSNDAAIKRLQSRLDGLEKQNSNLKRKRNLSAAQEGKSDGGEGKGKGKKKSGKSKHNVARTPAEWNGLPGVTPDGSPICYGFNLARGCPLVKPGEACHKGKHVCPKCFAAHSLMSCPSR